MTLSCADAGQTQMGCLNQKMELNLRCRERIQALRAPRMANESGRPAKAVEDKPG